MAGRSRRLGVFRGLGEVVVVAAELPPVEVRDNAGFGPGSGGVVLLPEDDVGGPVTVEVELPLPLESNGGRRSTGMLSCETILSRTSSFRRLYFWKKRVQEVGGRVCRAVDVTKVERMNCHAFVLRFKI